MSPTNFLEPKEAEIVVSYMRDKEAFVKLYPELAINALELYNKYIQLMTKSYIAMVRNYQFLKDNVDLNIKPFGIYSLNQPLIRVN